VAVEIPSTLEFLLGRWSIERVIEDHRDAATVRFTGEALVTLAEGEGEGEGEGEARASYVEQGQMSLGAHTGPARRTLGLHERGDGTVALEFPDGRPFLELDLCAGRSRATHPCGADSYELAFEVLGPNKLLERWRVSGPAKDYDAETVWRRR
jgi:hypothetical protein